GLRTTCPVGTNTSADILRLTLGTLSTCKSFCAGCHSRRISLPALAPEDRILESGGPVDSVPAANAHVADGARVDWPCRGSWLIIFWHAGNSSVRRASNAAAQVLSARAIASTPEVVAGATGYGSSLPMHGRPRSAKNCSKTALCSRVSPNFGFFARQ